MAEALILKGGGGADTSVVTATASDVLKDKVIVDADGNPLTGTMSNNGAVSSTLGAGESYTVPAGYHNGSGKVAVQSLATITSAGTVTSNSQILSGYKAYSDGTLYTGSMADQGAKTASLNCGDSYTIPAGYHNGSGEVTANSLSSQTSATATAAQILSGKTAWVKGSKLTGTISSLNGGTYTPSTSKQTISCAGRYMNSNITINPISSNYLGIGDAYFFNNGAFGPLYNLLGVAQKRPSGGYFGNNFTANWTDNTGDFTFKTITAVDNKIYWKAEQNLRNFTSFSTNKSLDFTNINEITLVTKGSSYSQHHGRLWVVNVNTLKGWSAFAYGPTHDSVETTVLDCSSISGYCVFGYYLDRIDSTSNTNSSIYISSLVLS